MKLKKILTAKREVMFLETEEEKKEMYRKFFRLIVESEDFVVIHRKNGGYDVYIKVLD